ncbi:DUF934 domain-containing protein [Pseudogemmobacter sonorensis]|uniref:DUF934 domain-containing protein n=1 Tax=Pseudogemmobacter sonorensis TaxID=2989681 RepID=UPI0036A02785
MSVIVTDSGFAPAPDRSLPGLDSLSDPAGIDAALDAGTTEIDLSNTDDPAALIPHLARLRLIRVAFPAFSDGRAFTIARRLRLEGYQGRLLALGPVIADQYAMLRRVGFDGAEIPDELAARQPEGQWKARADWRAHDYQSRLRA